MEREEGPRSVSSLGPLNRLVSGHHPRSAAGGPEDSGTREHNSASLSWPARRSVGTVGPSGPSLAAAVWCWSSSSGWFWASLCSQVGVPFPQFTPFLGPSSLLHPHAHQDLSYPQPSGTFSPETTPDLSLPSFQCFNPTFLSPGKRSIFSLGESWCLGYPRALGMSPRFPPAKLVPSSGLQLGILNLPTALRAAFQPTCPPPDSYLHPPFIHDSSLHPAHTYSDITDLAKSPALQQPCPVPHSRHLLALHLYNPEVLSQQPLL